MVAIMAILISKPSSSRKLRLLSPCYYHEQIQKYIFFYNPKTWANTFVNVTEEKISGR